MVHGNQQNTVMYSFKVSYSIAFIAAKPSPKNIEWKEKWKKVTYEKKEECSKKMSSCPTDFA